MADSTRNSPDGNIAAPSQPQQQVIVSANNVTLMQTAPAVAFSETNCRELLGIDPESWRETVRRLGVPCIEVQRGLCLVRADDFNEALRRLGKPLAPRKAASPAAPEPDAKTALLDRATRKGAA